MKYKTLEQLKDAYESGELDQDNPLWLDNDDTFVYDENDDERVYEGGAPDRNLLGEALELLGIPYDWV